MRSVPVPQRFFSGVRLRLASLVAVPLLLAACGSVGHGGRGADVLPAFVKSPQGDGTLLVVRHDGTPNADGTVSGQDLLTGGLGAAGLASATPPAYADPANPTALELRRAAIHTNYRALVDTTAAGGYGVLYGPHVDAAGKPTGGDGKVPGVEYLAYADDGSGRRNVTLMVQVPSAFDPARPCIVTATSSGSRGIYGGISVGEWGLKRGCAVAYTDKGTGPAPHDLQNDTVALVDGRRTTAAAAGNRAQFRADPSAAEQAAFNAATPNRFALKHAHSRQNPEKDWGRHTLQAIEFAFHVLNERHGTPLGNGRRERAITPANTLVIASAVSNGGGAALAAAEQDTGGLIDGVAVAEPQIQLPANPAVTVQRGGVTVASSGRPLYDYTSWANLYQACASQATSLAGAPQRALVNPTLATARCASLDDKALLAGEPPAELAERARLKLRRLGFEPESEPLYAVLAGLEVASAVTVAYANAYARASVADNLCGYGYAATTPVSGTGGGAVTTLAPAMLATMFATGNGVPPAAGIHIVNNASRGGPVRDIVSISPATGRQDLNLDGALCLRNLLTGSDAFSRRLRAGIDETRRSGNLRGKPALIVHGRADALVPVNHTSRPYLGLNRLVEGQAGRLGYIEVTNAQHFDAFIPFAGYDTRYVPLHVYLLRALDAMHAHLTAGTPLPPSQVVRTTPRGGVPGAATPITAANAATIVPPFATAATLAAGDAITVSGSTVAVPD